MLKIVQKEKGEKPLQLLYTKEEWIKLLQLKENQQIQFRLEVLGQILSCQDILRIPNNSPIANLSCNQKVKVLGNQVIKH